MFDLTAIQTALAEFDCDGWLLYDFRGSNVLARRVLGIDQEHPGSRRFFYFVPADGEPRKLVHRIEQGVLDHLPGEKHVYLAWQELEQGVKTLLGDSRRVALEYAPRATNPYISRIDAGTVELVQSFGVELVSSGDLIQRFEATWDDEQWGLHLEAAKLTDAAFSIAFKFIAERVRRQGEVHESEVIEQIVTHFTQHNAEYDHPPIVAVGPHSGDPHYETTPETDGLIRENDFVLIDLWCRVDHPRSVFSDVTRVGFVGRQVPERYTEVFGIVASARDAALVTIEEAFAANRLLQGYEVDRAARGVIEAAGYGEYFVHRTGHSIGREIHGNGANMDDLETHEMRRVMRGTCFSIEPGIYLPEFGIRCEVDVFVDHKGNVHVTGGPQQEVTPILARY